jgi:large subunit ribosomal protein L5
MAETTITPPRLRGRYESDVRGALQERFGYSSPMQLPRLQKITLNMGVGDAKTNSKALDAAVEELAIIAGQRPLITKAKKSIAGFKLREGMPIGVAVTLRGDRMWEFADRLISVVLPRIRDFRGVKSKLDGRGNYTMGLAEQTVFPEIDFDKLEFHQGMDITFVTTARSDEQGFHLLKELGMPFREEGQE